MTTTDTRPAPLTDERLAEAQRLFDAATADIPGTLPDEEVDRLVHERTVAERTFMMQVAPALLAEIRRQSHEFVQILIALDAMEDRASKTVFDDAFERGQATGLHAAVAGIRQILAGVAPVSESTS